MQSIKQIEKKILEHKKCVDILQDEIDARMDKEMQKEFQRLKKEVENFNKRFDGGDFVEDLQDAWKKEDEAKQQQEAGTYHAGE